MRKDSAKTRMVFHFSGLSWSCGSFNCDEKKVLYFELKGLSLCTGLWSWQSTDLALHGEFWSKYRYEILELTKLHSSSLVKNFKFAPVRNAWVKRGQLGTGWYSKCFVLVSLTARTARHLKGDQKPSPEGQPSHEDLYRTRSSEPSVSWFAVCRMCNETVTRSK